MQINPKFKRKSESKHKTKENSSTEKKAAATIVSSRSSRRVTPKSQTVPNSLNVSTVKSRSISGGLFSKQKRFSRNTVNILHSQFNTQQYPPSTKRPNSTTNSIRSGSMHSRVSHRKKSPQPKVEGRAYASSTEKKQTGKRLSSRKSRQQVSSMPTRKLDSRTSSRLSNKSPVIPELELNKSIASAGVGDLNEDLIKFIDQTEDEKEEPALSNLRKYQTRLVYVGSKIDHYARLVTLKKIREFSYQEKPLSTAYLKAGRSLCLLLKAFTCMDDSFRQIKEDETFADWGKIQ